MNKYEVDTPVYIDQLSGFDYGKRICRQNDLISKLPCEIHFNPSVKVISDSFISGLCSEIKFHKKVIPSILRIYIGTKRLDYKVKNKMRYVDE